MSSCCCSYSILFLYLNRAADKELYNEEVGHLLRTKSCDDNEGGIMAGFATIDSPLIVQPLNSDDLEYCKETCLNNWEMIHITVDGRVIRFQIADMQGICEESFRKVWNFEIKQRWNWRENNSMFSLDGTTTDLKVYTLQGHVSNSGNSSNRAINMWIFFKQIILFSRIS